MLHHAPAWDDPSGRSDVAKSLALHEKVDEAVRELDRQEIWEQCEKSEWALRMVKPIKPTGEVCTTIDFHLLNQSVVPMRFPLLIPEDLFLQTKGSCYFLKLDLIKGYHYIELHPDSRPLTATLMPLGLHQYCCSPSGLTDVGAVCQKLVHEMLAGLDGIITYIDDILIFAETVEQHNSIPRQVLQCLQVHDFWLQLCKCAFHKTEVPFLGHLLLEHGVQPDMEHAKAIKEAPAPMGFKQLRPFLSLVTYFLPNCSVGCLV